MNELLNQFIEIVGINNLIYEPSQKISYETDWRKRYQGIALAVIFPQNLEQIKLIIRTCRQNNIAIVPQGGNTSSCGGATPLLSHINPQIILNLKHLNKIVAIDEKNFSIEVEAGCTLAQVQNYAQQFNLYFPLSLASEGSCTIGGNIATNAGGIHVIKYGNTRDLILGLEAVLADESIINQMYSLRKNNTNFDLKQLFIGSEGTLGIITKAILKLYPNPDEYITMSLNLDSIDLAISLFQKLKLNFGNNLSAFEIIYKDTLTIYNKHFPDKSMVVDGDWLVIFELESNKYFNNDILFNFMSEIGINLDKVNYASNNKERDFIWQLRENIPIAEKLESYAVKHDISLPISSLNEFLLTNLAKLKQYFPNCYLSIFGHLGDGNLHYNVGLIGSSKQTIDQLETLVNPIVYADVAKFGGSFAAEHGVGITKKNWMKHYYDNQSYRLLKQIKQLVDPNNLFNPGKILD